jgi:hypothetical protein
MGGLRRPWIRRPQVLATPEQRTGQRYRLQNLSRVLLERKGKFRHHKRKSGGL